MLIQKRRRDICLILFSNFGNKISWSFILHQGIINIIDFILFSPCLSSCGWNIDFWFFFNFFSALKGFKQSIFFLFAFFLSRSLLWYFYWVLGLILSIFLGFWGFSICFLPDGLLSLFYFLLYDNGCIWGIWYLLF